MAATYKQQLASAQSKLAALVARIAELEPLAAAEPDTSVDLSTLIGTTVFARVGRCTADGKIPRIVEAVVVAAKAGEGKTPDQVRVTFGDGFDAEFVTLPTSAIANTREAADAALSLVVSDYKKAKEAAEAAAKAAEEAKAAAEAAAAAAADNE